MSFRRRSRGKKKSHRRRRISSYGGSRGGIRL